MSSPAGLAWAKSKFIAFSWTATGYLGTFAITGAPAAVVFSLMTLENLCLARSVGPGGGSVEGPPVDPPPPSPPGAAASAPPPASGALEEPPLPPLPAVPLPPEPPEPPEPALAPPLPPPEPAWAPDPPDPLEPPAPVPPRPPVPEPPEPPVVLGGWPPLGSFGVQPSSRPRVMEKNAAAGTAKDFTWWDVA